MPSTFSTSLRLELQANGENRTTWGTKANQVFNMVEDAVAGYVSIAMANANYVLTTANGSVDEARNMMINLTGAHTAIRTLTIPAVSKSYIVRNATTGGFAVTISNGINSVNLNNGQWAIVWTDGTNMFVGSDQAPGVVYALLSQLADLSGVSNKPTARTNLGVAIGTDVQAFDTGLAALAAYNTNGLLTQTANNTFTGRVVTGTANQITVTNGDGVAGNPTLSFPSTVDFTGKTVTGLTTIDSSLSIIDQVDATKVAKFELSGISTGTTRTYTLPNASSTLVDLATVQTLSNKSFGATTFSGGITGTTGTFSGALTATGNITSGASIVGLQNFISSTTAFVAAPASAGTVYLRPNGAGSGTGQTFVTSGGDMTVSGDFTSTGNMVVSGNINASAGIAAAGTVFAGGVPCLTASTLTAALDTGIAAMGTGTVGTYAFLRAAPGVVITEGGSYTNASAGLIYSSIDGAGALSAGGAVSGTWRAMGRCNGTASAAATLFLRIA